MFDRRLIRNINSGRCFALVGSGPSCDVGYKSWSKLAEDTYKTLSTTGDKVDEESYQRYLSQHKYPELFRQAEIDIGNRISLLALVKRLLYPSSRQTGVIYNFLAEWPFACYLTTNFDDEILEHLKRIGVHFGTLRNRPEDFYPIRDGATNYVLKLHSDLDHPDEVILTSPDYDRLETKPSGDYYRERLKAIFQMFDVLIVGHSLNDPDIAQILKFVKNIADRNRPVFMVAAGFTKAEEREYSEKYNIELISYENTDGSHSQLRRLLKVADKWIIPRRSRIDRVEYKKPPETEIDRASSLYLFRKLKPISTGEYLAPLILAALAEAGGEGLRLADIVIQSSPRKQTGNGPDTELQNAVVENLSRLREAGLVEAKDDRFAITPEGSRRIGESRRIRQSETEQAYGQFLVDLRNSYPALTTKQEQVCRDLAETAIVDTFARRGMIIANRIFAKQSANPDELSDVFEIVSRMAGKLEADAAAAFVEAMHHFLINPNGPQRDYLASLSQGYFLYHLLGLDPNLKQLRLEVLQHTLWLCDSSVLLPLVAQNCYNHEYAVELFRLLKVAEANLFTTTSLMDEAWDHFNWAMRFVRECGVDSPEFLRAALVKGSYKQNLFVDGYVRSAADGLVGTFGDYLKMVSPSGIDRISFEKAFQDYDVPLIHLSQIPGFKVDDWAELEEAKTAIKKERVARGTLRSELQIAAEAEVWLLLKNLRGGQYKVSGGIDLDNVYFISQSRLLDRVFPGTKVITWTPEAVYRYLASLPDAKVEPGLLQQCMTNEYFYAGISFIDEKRYLRFFGPSIEQAKMLFEKEKAEYIKAVEQENRSLEQLTLEFDSVPDLEKPFFMSQMGWRLAEVLQDRVASESKRAFQAEQRIKLMVSKKPSRKVLKVAEKEEAARLRHLSDPKYLAKKRRQAKKRNKKGK